MEKILTSQNFESFISNTDKPILVDFWATWCGPCLMLSPIVKEIAEEYPQYLVGKVNVDEQRELAINFEIASIPTLLVFKDGKVVSQSVGYQPKQKIVEMLKQAEA